MNTQMHSRFVTRRRLLHWLATGAFSLASNAAGRSPTGVVISGGRRPVAAGLGKANLVAWWEGDSANDSHSNALHLSSLGGCGYGTDPWGNANAAWLWSNTTGPSRAFAAAMNPSPISVHFWAKIPGFSALGIDRLYEAYGKRAWKLAIQPHSGARFDWAYSTTAVAVPVTAGGPFANYGVWCFFAAGWDGSQIWASVNAATPATASESRGPSNGANALIFSNGVNGASMCRVGIWGCDLRSPPAGNPTLAQLYNTGGGRRYAEL